jgi:large subunit ribosomal protein L23
MSVQQTRLMKVLIAPIISEKSTQTADQSTQIAFKVEKSANKLDIKKAVELMFEVEVDKVRVLNVKGKVKRFGRTLGKRSDWKKAYVKLKPGQDLDFASA